MNSLIIAMGLLSVVDANANATANVKPRVAKRDCVLCFDQSEHDEPPLKRAKLSSNNIFDKPFVMPDFIVCSVAPGRQYNFGVNFYRDLACARASAGACAGAAESEEAYGAGPMDIEEPEEEPEEDDEDINEIIHQLGIYDNEVIAANGNLSFVLEAEEMEEAQASDEEEEEAQASDEEEEKEEVEEAEEEAEEAEEEVEEAEEEAEANNYEDYEYEESDEEAQASDEEDDDAYGRWWLCWML